jgi:hypothetical protein
LSKLVPALVKDAGGLANVQYFVAVAPISFPGS